MTDYRRPDPNAEHAPSPAEDLLKRPREGASIPIVAVILAVIIIGGGLILYNRGHTTNTAQLAPPATQSAPSAATPKSQQPIRSNPAGTR